MDVIVIAVGFLVRSCAHDIDCMERNPGWRVFFFPARRLRERDLLSCRTKSKRWRCKSVIGWSRQSACGWRPIACASLARYCMPSYAIANIIVELTNASDSSIDVHAVTAVVDGNICLSSSSSSYTCLK